MFIAESGTTNLEGLLEKASDAYYNEGNVYRLKASDLASIPAALRKSAALKVNSPVTDAIFDELLDLLKTQNPKSAFLKKVGAPIAGKKQKVKLPVPMPSLEKRKPGTVDGWLDTRKPPYMVSLKLDGSSIELEYRKNQQVRVYSRGDGVTGGDISFLAPALNIPQKLPFDTILRGEAIIPKALFSKHWGSSFENPRAMANGITNRTDAHPGLKHMDVIIYRQLLPKAVPSTALTALKKHGFKIVPKMVTDDLDEALLVEILQKYKETYTHEIDGLVVVQDKAVMPPTSNEKPADAFAFKDNSVDDSAQTRVVRVNWTANRTGLIFPQVQIEPVKVGGVTISYATGKSGAYIQRSGIGPGAVVVVARSGGVIPEIRQVLKKVKPQLPDIDYEWRGENCFAVNAQKHESVVASTIQHFFTTLGIENFKGATIAKFMDAGYNSVPKILAMPKQKFVNITGGSVVLQKVYDQLQAAIKDVPLATLIDASGIFGHGIGTRKAAAAITAVPNLMTLPAETVLDKLSVAPGFGAATAEKFVAALEPFKKWVEKTPITWIVPKKKAPTKGPLSGHSIMFTGFRSAEMESEIERLGGSVASSIGKATMLVAKDPNSTSAKSNVARKMGIPILSPDGFEKFLKGKK